MSKKLKSAVIYGELADYMTVMFKKHPEFADPTIKILDIVAKLHDLNLDYKNTNRLKIQDQYLTEITNTLTVSFDKNLVSLENMDYIFNSISKLNEADKDYLLDYFDKKKKAYEGILVAVNNVSTALDRACGRIPEEPKEKFSLFKAIGNFFNSKNKENEITAFKEKEFAQKEFNELLTLKKNKF